MDEAGKVKAGGCIGIRYPSPRRIVARWFSPQRKVQGKKKRVRQCDVVKIKTCSSQDDHGLGQSSDSSPPIINSELQSREFLFSIGLSCYLLHLINTSREEIHKLVKLRNDLEKLLQCLNHEPRRKHQEEYHTETSAYSTTSDVVDQYYSPEIVETCVGGEGSLSHYVFKQGEDSRGEMDELEAELEAEFEHLHIGQDQSEASEGLRLGHVCSGVVEEQQGVCPYELERRLYKLMEIRQEEEIKELEIALEDAKKKLQLKEKEASWWKDTAYIVSERIPEPSRINSSSRTYTYPFSR